MFLKLGYLYCTQIVFLGTNDKPETSNNKRHSAFLDSLSLTLKVKMNAVKDAVTGLYQCLNLCAIVEASLYYMHAGVCPVQLPDR